MSTGKNPVVHFEIGCMNRAETKTFYEHCFDWKITSNENSDDINTGSEHGISGHITSLGHEPNNYLNFYIQVDNISDALAKIEQEGGKTVVPPVTLPGGEIFAWFSDVAGNTVGLLTKPN